ncbi:MAG: ABC transporter ATP-binding protein [Gemmataceae bacterium]
MAAIQLDSVKKVFPNSQVALHELSLEVGDGEFLVLVGPSGCGKSTTLRLVAGLETPTSGRIQIGPREVTYLPPQERDLAMVFQNYALYPHKSVRQNLEFGLRMRQVGTDVIDTRVKKVAEVLGLEVLLERKPSQLSGGQRQRVALGRAMVREPAAFLLDEPLSNLDARLRVQTRAELARMHRSLKATMLYVTHDQEEAMTLGDRVAVLNEGRLQQLAPPMEIYRRPVNAFVAGFIGSPAMNFFRCKHRQEASSKLETGEFSLQFANQLPAGAEVLLGIRPQDIRLAEGDQGDARARVDVVQPLGSDIVIHLNLLGGSETARATLVQPAERALRVDDQVEINFPRDRLHLFDGKSEQRLN